ncbi:ABC transporter [Gordonibacter sp. 28C]|uniref:ABC transporter ATP-binding protein n=1 Tax=Gordonibacter sp. 28C TaxID=2078569 RepID=UPI000DF7FB3A|nr:ABC transporter ATP-binding protein [Gordonibacter sp. 28C]RDB58972.1 ABC transporter [Gordonibacter sp. 28C]
MPENVNTSALTNAPESTSADNRETMIKVDHVSMVFNMASEQLNSLKEYAIKIARRELFFEGFTALDDISFEVKKGDVFGIMGTNGSGKSTMLKIIAGVLEPSKGSCQVNGNIAPLIELGAGFDTELSARENIYLNGSLLGYSKAFVTEHFDEIVKFAEIEKFLDMPLKNYSSGMVARIAFAIATVIVPEILVVDEVLSVGDFMFQKKCEDRISELIEKHGVTVLIVSHSNTQVERLCNKAIWIEKGHTRMMGQASKVCRIYGGLGGRTGSSESEKRVFEALRETGEIEDDDKLHWYETIAGENADGVNSRLALRAWEDESIGAVAVACGASHINAIMANAIASAHNAPVLTTKSDALPDSVERILHEAKPNIIFAIDCGNQAGQALAELDELPWHPHVVRFCREDGDVHKLSWQMIDYGLENKLFEKHAALIDFADNPISLTAGPYLYAKRCPLIVTLDEKPVSANEIADEICRRGIKTLCVFGTNAAPGIEDALAQSDCVVTRITGEGTSDICLKISQLSLDATSKLQDDEPRELCIASLSIAQWPELVACGGYAAKRGGALLLEDQTDLDSIKACLDFIEVNFDSIDCITAIGNQIGLSDFDKELLGRYLTLVKKQSGISTVIGNGRKTDQDCRSRRDLHTDNTLTNDRENEPPRA